MKDVKSATENPLLFSNDWGFDWIFCKQSRFKNNLGSPCMQMNIYIWREKFIEWLGKFRDTILILFWIVAKNINFFFKLFRRR
jgi:hypothetical protein